MIHDYHCGKDKMLVAGKGNEHVGIELEFFPTVEWGKALGHKGRNALTAQQLVRTRLAAYLESSLDACGIRSSLFTFESDSSLRDPALRYSSWGAEMVSRVLSLRVAKKLPWKAFFEKLQEDGIVQLGHESCGLHIHGNPFYGRGESKHDMEIKKAYSCKLWAALLCLTNAERLFLFGRERNKYCEDWINTSTTETIDDDYGEEVDQTIELDAEVGDIGDYIGWPGSMFRYECRYVPLNLSGRTGEFRMFASPENGNQLLGAIEVVEKLWYAKEPIFSEEEVPEGEFFGRHWAEEMLEYLRKHTRTGGLANAGWKASSS